MVGDGGSVTIRAARKQRSLGETRNPGRKGVQLEPFLIGPVYLPRARLPYWRMTTLEFVCAATVGQRPVRSPIDASPSLTAVNNTPK